MLDLRSRSRRAFVVPAILATALVVGLIAAPGAVAKVKGFSYGVASGDVGTKSAILWAKADKSGKTELQLVSNEGFGKCNVKKGQYVVKAKSDNDNTVQKKVTGLKPDKTYKYRWCQSSKKVSAVGTFTTAPKANKAKTIHFALAGDQDARPLASDPKGPPYWNNFQVWKRIKAQKNDFNVLMGDTIYSDTEVPGYTNKDIALSVKEKRKAYKTNLAQKAWTKVRGQTSYYAHWDDHEFINDFAQGENNFPYSNDGTTYPPTKMSGKKIYKNGVKAFTEYNPITYSKKTGIYRSQRWGKNLEVFFLDERSFRSNRADYSGACDNPPGSGDPDLAPTAPQSTRSLFSAIVPQLANPVPQSCLDAINDPNQTMLGHNQLKTFEKAIKNSDATFKVIFNEVPIQQFYALPYDRWEGYANEREKLLHFLQDNVKNSIFMTTDVHANLVNDARFSTLGPDGVQNSGILDVTNGPIATQNYAGEISGATGNPAAGALITSAFLQPQPPAGVGMQCAATDQFSYAEATVTKKQLKIDLLDANDKPVLNTGDAGADPQTAQPCDSVVLKAK